MLDRLLKLPGTAQTHMLVVKIRPPDLEQLSRPGSDDGQDLHGGDGGAHDARGDAHPVDAADDAEGDGDVAEACPICEGEHEPIEITPDLGMLLAHLASELATGRQEGDQGDGHRGNADDDEGEAEGEGDGVHDEEDLHFMRM